MSQLVLPLNYDQVLPQDFTNLVIYRSSAGSGKTFTLVKDYIKLLLKDTDNYRRILALTFTNKATEEMKTRILKELEAMSLGEKTDMQAAIEREFELEFAKTKTHIPPIAKRAGLALEKILHNYGKFGVSTLDHFFTRVVRSMARELDLPLKYDIDVDNDRAIDFAIAETYKMLDDDEGLRSWLEDFSFTKIENDKAWNPDLELKSLGKELFNENFQKGIGDNKIPLDEFKKFVLVLKDRKSRFEKKMKIYGEIGLEIIETHELTSEDFFSKGAGNVNEFKKFVKGEFEKLGKRFIAIAKGEAEWYTKTSHKKNEIDAAAADGLNQVTQNACQYHLSEQASYLSAFHLLKNIFAYGILEVLEEKLKDYRSENNLVLLADNAFLMNKFITDQDAPFIYEKIGSRYTHILIDEFQDTSLFQWNNLLPLIRNSLYENGQVLIVGDEKQSIYRWRGGEMRLLVSGIEDDLSHFKKQTEVKMLDTNYRSSKTIVDFNNNFFSMAADLLQRNENFPAGETLMADTFQNVHQKNNKESKGYVEVQFFASEQDEENEIGWKDKAKAETIRVIKNSLEQGYRPGDILILIDRWVLGDEIAHHLITNGLPIISDKTLQVQNSPKVKLLLSALKWLHNTEDNLAKTNLLFLFIEFKNMSNYDYHSIFTDIHNQGVLFNQILPEEFLNNLRVFLRLPLYELVENLVIVFELGNKTDNFVLRFMEICLEQSAWGRNDLYAFLSWWDNLKESQTVIMPETDDAIWIMTIHKAKGLERPIVIMPFANLDLRTKGYSTFWTDKISEEYKPFKLLPLNFSSKLMGTDFEEAYKNELQDGTVERLNNVYVAFTRAIDRLYIFTEFQKKIAEPKDIGSLSSLLKALLSGGVLIPEGNAGSLTEGRGQSSEEIYVWGNEIQASLKQKDLKESVEDLNPVISNPINDKIKIKTESNRFFLLFDNEKSAAIKRGLILHRLFELATGPASLGRAVNQLQSEGLVHDHQIQNILTIARTFFEKEEFINWFDGSWEVINEREILFESRVYRPDKVLIKKEETVVIDYKSGARESKHKKQILYYGSLLNKMGYRSIKMYLIYLDQEEIEEVEGLY